MELVGIRKVLAILVVSLELQPIYVEQRFLTYLTRALWPFQKVSLI